jgi:uncharacterized coiled-coil protein SlyX
LLYDACVEDRISELEIRFTLQQDLLQQLSDVVARHEREIARLRSQVDELRKPREGGQLPLEENEKPPHY